MSTVASRKLEPRFEIVQAETISVSETQQLKMQIAKLEHENAELQMLLEQDAVVGFVSRSNQRQVEPIAIQTVRRPPPIDLPELED
jgi:hypothetical protein